MTQFKIPPKPQLKKRKTPPRKTQFAIMPLRALTDKRITDRNRTVLAMMSSFASRAGNYLGDAQKNRGRVWDYQASNPKDDRETQGIRLH